MSNVTSITEAKGQVERATKEANQALEQVIQLSMMCARLGEALNSALPIVEFATHDGNHAKCTSGCAYMQMLEAIKEVDRYGK